MLENVRLSSDTNASFEITIIKKQIAIPILPPYANIFRFGIKIVTPKNRTHIPVPIADQIANFEFVSVNINLLLVVFVILLLSHQIATVNNFSDYQRIRNFFHKDDSILSWPSIIFNYANSIIVRLSQKIHTNTFMKIYRILISRSCNCL
jgi:hypothetical protein